MYGGVVYVRVVLLVGLVDLIGLSEVVLDVVEYLKL